MPANLLMPQAAPRRREDDRFAWLQEQLKRMPPDSEMRAELKLAIQAAIRNFEADVVAELVDAISVQRIGKQPTVSLVFEHWRRRSPSILYRMNKTLRHAWPQALGISQGQPLPLFDEAEQFPCPFMVEDFTKGFEPVHPAEPQDERDNIYYSLMDMDVRKFALPGLGFRTLLLTRPLIFRGYGHFERWPSAFSERWGAERDCWVNHATAIGKISDWLEHQAVRLKDAGALNSDIPIVLQVKEKFGTLRYHARVPSYLRGEFAKQYRAAWQPAFVSRHTTQFVTPGEYSENSSTRSSS
jgi:hypothetical protein